ncbi:CoA pyrophosphatase [Sphingomonas sediminicola]|uniref:CoA pyrophosphatase n=1 Tax=Sphingomonas sediminicola TaxID=386874 RepID=UPI003CF145D3
MSLIDRLREALTQPSVLPLLEGDLPEERALASVPAAVLVGITDRPDPGVILTVRREHMRTHAGQVAFPGGRIDPGENSVEAALREAWEELGLDPGAAEIVGAIDPYRTVTGYVVTPVLAVVQPDQPLSPHEHEVADWFEAPLGFVLDPTNQQYKSALFQGRERHYYEIMWGERRIWGATASMIVNLSRRLQWN